MQVVGRAEQGGELHVDFALPGRGDFVMLGLDLDAALLQREHHLGADVLQRVGRRDVGK